MASRARTRTIRTFLPAAAAAMLLGGCSGGDTTHVGFSLPSPEPGKVTSFDIDQLSTRYHINDVIDGGGYGSYVTADGSGNVYMVNGDNSPVDILRMTTGGDVSRFARIASLSAVRGMTHMPDGDLLIGQAGGLMRVDRHGTASPLQTSHHFDYPSPVGVRADGEVIVLDGGSVWSLKDGNVSRLYGSFGSSGGRGAVDQSGTAYIQPQNGSTFAGMFVLAPGTEPHELQISGSLPGSQVPISGLTPLSLTAAPGGGFYAMATKASDTTKVYAVYVQGANATVLAEGSTKNTCPANKQYPALDNPCTMPWFVVQSGKRVLAMGSSTGQPLPALVISAPAK